MLVVNHGGREAIEIFAVDYRDTRKQPALRWQGCLAMPAGHVANSVASYSDGTVIATVLTRPGTSITDFVRGQPTGGVYERARRRTGFPLAAGHGTAGQ
ncbi:hypothetical protein ACFOKF_25370 [Sphingobium rhizovicinum]|uniref:Uncharacterized protein n=1 Tax=Sphingobium rhizovicinum TaxID=432308 RepID=A0ABV7NNN5_9SPHN